MRPQCQGRVRLESLGFKSVCYYKPGKADWMAHDLPTIRKIDTAQSLIVIDRMDREVSTCRANEPLRVVRERAQHKLYSLCAVINEAGIVLGIVSEREWESDPTASAEQWMDPGPTTLRPSDSRIKRSIYSRRAPAPFWSPTRTVSSWVPLPANKKNNNCRSRRSGLRSVVNSSWKVSAES